MVQLTLVAPPMLVRPSTTTLTITTRARQPRAMLSAMVTGAKVQGVHALRLSNCYQRCLRYSPHLQHQRRRLTRLVPLLFRVAYKRAARHLPQPLLRFPPLRKCTSRHRHTPSFMLRLTQHTLLMPPGQWAQLTLLSRCSPLHIPAPLVATCFNAPSRKHRWRPRLRQFLSVSALLARLQRLLLSSLILALRLALPLENKALRRAPTLLTLVQVLLRHVCSTRRPPLNASPLPSEALSLTSTPLMWVRTLAFRHSRAMLALAAHPCILLAWAHPQRHRLLLLALLSLPCVHRSCLYLTLRHDGTLLTLHTISPLTFPLLTVLCAPLLRR